MDRLNAAVRKVKQDAELKTLLAKLGFDMYATTTAVAQSDLLADIDLHGKLVQKARLFMGKDK